MTDFPGIPKNAAIHVWTCEWAKGPDGWANLARAFLTDEERAKADRCKIPEDRLRFTAARALLRKISGAYLMRDGKMLRLETAVSGKPFWREHHERLQFNLSHSGGWIALAFASDMEVGIDVQHKDESRKIDGLKIARRFFHPLENEALSSCPADRQADLFYALWTCKEAVVKAMGEGLHGGLEKFSAIPPAQNPQQWTPVSGAIPAPCLFRTLEIDGQHIGALAGRTDALPEVRAFSAALVFQDGL